MVLVFKCKLTDEEVIDGSYPSTEEFGGEVLAFKSKTIVCKRENYDNIGEVEKVEGEAAAEPEEDEVKNNIISAFHYEQDDYENIGQFLGDWKTYMKRLKEVLVEKNTPAPAIESFQKAMGDLTKFIREKWDNILIYKKEYDCIIPAYVDDRNAEVKEPTFYIIKQAVVGEKY